MYVYFKKWLQDGAALPPDESLKEELLSVDYFYTASGKMQLVLKKTIKEILGRSPDRADACAFNFYEQMIRNVWSNGAVDRTTDWPIFG